MTPEIIRKELLKVRTYLENRGVIKPKKPPEETLKDDPYTIHNTSHPTLSEKKYEEERLKEIERRSFEKAEIKADELGF